VSRRQLLAPLVGLVALVATTPAHASSSFQWGVAAGDVTSTSAILWSKTDHPGAVRFEVALVPHPHFDLQQSPKVVASKARDDTLRAKVSGLKPGTRYYFGFTDGHDVSPVGTFKTAPAPTSTQTIRFGWSGDEDGTPAPGKKTPYWNSLQVLGRMAAERNDFNVNLGDTIYSDSEVPGVEGKQQALTVPQKWAKYDLIVSQRNAQKFRDSGATYWHWDDHEFINDFSPAENTFSASGGTKVDIAGSTLYKRGKQAFLDWMPTGFRNGTGLYRTFRWGKSLEVFMLDERSFRSAKAASACINPQSGQPDLAPTAPQRTRDVFAIIVPSLSQPVSQSCLDTIRNPARTFLGAAQWAAFTRDLRASTATWKVVMTEMEAKQYYSLPYDRWEGYEAERQRLLNLLKTVPNTVLLATDVHANLAVDARLQTLEDPGPVNSGVFEMSTGPVATKNFNQEISDAVNNPAAGNLVVSAFLKPPPPNGIGMDCVASKVFSYGEVTASPTTLKIQPKDQNGAPVKQDDGTPCGPFTMTAK
jgi:phosphodiesterase/alkaline phosphatase D-like protein